MDPDQPAHPSRLISIHAFRLQTLLQAEKLIANSMDPDQTAFILCWFCHGAAHICTCLLVENLTRDKLI
jgi:hypothetical protein